MNKVDILYSHNTILYRHAIIFSFKNEGNPDLYNNMDETRGHYVKWNTPDPERQILYGLCYKRNLN